MAFEPKTEWTKADLKQNAEINKHKQLLEELAVRVANLENGDPEHLLRRLLKGLVGL